MNKQALGPNDQNPAPQGAPTPGAPTPSVSSPSAPAPAANPVPPMPGNDGPDISMMEGSINQISNAGRSILKSIEEYKFKVDQVGRILKNNQQVTQLLEAKKKNLDAAANEIYQLVFSIENINIINVANQVPGMNNGTPGQAPGQNPAQPNKPGQPPVQKPESEDAKKDENSGMPDEVKR